MSTYPYDGTQPEQKARSSSVQPAKRRAGTTALLALALAGSAAGGGVIGSVATADRLGEARDATPSASAASLTTQPLQSGDMGTASVAGAVYARAGGAVVDVIASGGSPGRFSPQGGGSGFVVDARGLILTNNHVVDGAESVQVRFVDGTERDAKVLGRDSGNDLALVRVNELPKDTPVASLGDSDQVQVGETAIAIGSPFGLGQTVTQGIVSAVDRDWAAGGGRTMRDLIQTDTAINPGNSGGPLLNARGEVIGINTFNESPVRGSVGVGFAVPVNIAKQLLPRLEAGEEIKPAWMGIAGTDLDAETARQEGLEVEKGILITDVVEGGPADRAGLRGGEDSNGQRPSGGDVITAVDGAAVAEISELVERLASKQPGDKVTVTISRDGNERKVTVTLGEWPEQQIERIP